MKKRLKNYKKKQNKKNKKRIQLEKEIEERKRQEEKRKKEEEERKKREEEERRKKEEEERIRREKEERIRREKERIEEERRRAQYFPRAINVGCSIVDGLKSIGANSSYNYRCSIAARNGIGGYVGSPAQNTHMLDLLKNGTLLRP